MKNALNIAALRVAPPRRTTHRFAAQRNTTQRLPKEHLCATPRFAPLRAAPQLNATTTMNEHRCASHRLTPRRVAAQRNATTNITGE